MTHEYLDYYSSDYQTARRRFRDALGLFGVPLRSYPIDARGIADEELAIDVATLGSEDPRGVVVVSSGLHGVEGYFGSAAQLAWLDQFVRHPTLPSDMAIVFIHALNPYGFSHQRRWNEDNIDLNRNFLSDADRFEGMPRGYQQLDQLLNPDSPPRRDMFSVRAAWQVMRHGMRTMKNAIAVGQYDRPSGLFFGGSRAAQTTQIVQREFSHWVGAAETILHVDLHSGLGAFGDYKILVADQDDPSEHRWHVENFGERYVQPMSHGVAYPARGTMAQWLLQHFHDRKYRMVGVEFGTYSPIRVLRALRSENQLHQHGTRSASDKVKIKRELLECFCPASDRWRNMVAAKTLGVIAATISAIQRTAASHA